MSKPFLLCVTLLLLCWPLISSGLEIKISSHPAYPPVMFERDGKLFGMTIDIATALFNSLNQPHRFVFSGPWNRVQQRARSGHIDMIAGIYRNKKREKYLLYSIPVLENPDVVFVKTGREFPFQTLEDLIGKKGTTNLGESFGNKIDQFIESKLNVQRVVKNKMNYKLLDLERVDYFLYGLYPGKAQAERLGYGGKIKALKTPLATEHYHFAFSKKSTFKSLLPKVDDFLKHYLTEKRIQSLYEKNLQLYLGNNKSG